MTTDVFAAPLALISMPGPFEMILLAGLGLLFFGRRLPEVGRSIGQTIVEFKKGLNEASHEVTKPAGFEPTTPATPALTDTSNFKFDPHTGKPIERPTV